MVDVSYEDYQDLVRKLSLANERVRDLQERVSGRDAHIAALEAQLAERVRVKPLVWNECRALYGGRKLVATDCFGREYARLDLKGQPDDFISDFKARVQEAYNTAILSALEATAAPQTAERVRVKPLVWKELPGNQHCNIAFTADTIGGSFVIEERAGDTFDLWRTAQEIARRFSTLDEAKAAAQDWHNNAVAEVLEATAAPEQRELSAEDVATFDRALLRSGRKAEATPPAPVTTECDYALTRDELAAAAADVSLSDAAVRYLCIARKGVIPPEVTQWAAAIAKAEGRS